jgi:WD40 repeat protein
MFAVVFSVEAQTELAPFLYYYSDVLNAFVIERADGTDSRVFAEGVMPDTNFVRGAGWSPSGKWFAWRGSDVNGEGVGPYTGAWIISADGTNRVNVFDELDGYIYYMEWSPVEDLLLVFVMPKSTVDRRPTYYMIDANAAKITFSVEIPVYEEGFAPFFWTPDGEYAVFNRRDPFYRDFVQHIWFTVSKAGEVKEYRVDVDSWDVTTTDENGQISYVQPDGETIMVENLFSGDREMYSIAANHRIQTIIWSRDSSHAFIYALSPCAEGCRRVSLWLLTRNQTELQQIAEDVFDYPDMLRYNIDVPSFLWSRDGSSGVFVSADGMLKLLHLPSLKIDEVRDVKQHTSDGRFRIMVRSYWLADNQLLVTKGSDEPSIIYNVTPGEVIERQIFQDGFYEVRISPDEAHFAIMDRFSATVVNVPTQNTIEYLPHSGKASYRANYRWDVTSKWLFVVESHLFASGAKYPQDVTSVVNIDGTIQRELTTCPYNPVCADWLPESVIPHLASGQPTPVIQEPTMTLAHKGEVIGAAWSPDSHYIASYARDQSLSIWEVGETQAVRTKILSSPEVCENHPAPCYVSWSENGRFVATGPLVDKQDHSGENLSLLWDIDLGKPLEVVKGRYVTWLKDENYTASSDREVYSPDGKQKAVVRDWTSVEVMDLNSEQVIATLPTIWTNRVFWMPDSQRLVLHSEPQIIVWDPRSGEVLEMEIPHHRTFYEMTLSPDGRLIAGASIYHRIHIWETATGKLKKILNWYGRAIEFSPDGKWLLAGNTRAVTLWDVAKFDE